MRADKMVTNVQRNDIEQFLHDVRQYFIASLDTSEYENTSNMFHLTEAEQTANLLHRCDALLAQYSAAAPAQRQLVKNALSSMAASSTANGMKSNGSPLGGFVHRHAAARDCVDRPVAVEQPHQEEDATYLDMSAANTKQTIPSEAVDLNLSSAGDKALRYANINKGKRPEAPKVVPVAEEHTISINNSNNNGNNNNSNNNGNNNNSNNNNGNNSIRNNNGNNNNSNNNNYSSNNNSNNNIISNNNSNNNSNNKSNNNNHQRVSLMPDSQSHHSREDKVPASTSCANSASTSASTDEDPDSDDDERQVYDICLVSQMDDDDAGDLDGGDGEGERQRVISQADSDVFASAVPCPYSELPAGHLAIQQSSKYGQLQRIERRLFFDQSKKCYGGILNDWLLLYADGPTSSAASQTLHLKSPGVEIEHYGEGKRRDVCFQISTGDPNKRFVFQAANEVDAKEWIHAIEAAIRSDTKAAAETAATPTNANTSRKLPTPPTLKRMTFISVGQNNNNNNNNNHNDCIYEEPEHLYAVHEQPTDLLLDDGKGDERAKQEEFNRSFEYDIPKSPPQPVLPPKSGRLDSPTEAEGFLLKPVTDSSGPVPKPSEGGSFRAKTPDSSGVFGKAAASSPLASPVKSPPVPSSTPPKSGGRHSLMPDKALDFQAKVKDVHHKLSSQLSAGLSPDRYRSKKAYTQCSNEMEFVAFNGAAADVTPPKHAPKDQKKPKKSDSPNGSAVTAAVTTPQPRKNSTASGSGLGEKSSKNWFLNRLNKSTSSTRSAGGAAAALAAAAASKSPSGKHSGEKENLLNSLETYEHGGGGECQPLAGGNPASPILLKGGGGGGGGCGGGGGDGGGVGSKSKVNMIINQLEASGHLASMFSMDAFTTFCGGGSNGGVSANDCNNYEPIMTMSTPPTSLMKKV